MEITLETFLIVCPLVFLAGLVDAIGGGGGLISMPAYLIAGLPPHFAKATNKLSSACGTTLATARFIKNGLVDYKIAIPTLITALIGSYVGANVSLALTEKVMLYIMLGVLPICAFLVFNKKLFRDSDAEFKPTIKTYVIVSICSLVIGFYDGFYGPGTGTFLIIAFTTFAKMSIRTANAQAKVINLTTNITSLAVFIFNGQVLFTIGLAAAACNMLGGYIGAGLVMKNGSKIVKPSIVLVLILLILKLLGVFDV